LVLRGRVVVSRGPAPFADPLSSSAATRQANDRSAPTSRLINTKPASPSSSMRIKRWTIEVAFEESRAHLGIETQRQWSESSD
jgi:hypothetical protein